MILSTLRLILCRHLLFVTHVLGYSDVKNFDFTYYKHMLTIVRRVHGTIDAHASRRMGDSRGGSCADLGRSFVCHNEQE